MRKAFDWKRSRISMLKVEATPELYSVSPDWFEYYFIYEKFEPISYSWSATEHSSTYHCIRFDTIC
jgi:hypothetical protein